MVELTELQGDIMEFCRRTQFHSTLADFLRANPHIDQAQAIEALRDLKRKGVAGCGPDILTSWIAVTRSGRKALHWYD